VRRYRREVTERKIVERDVTIRIPKGYVALVTRGRASFVGCVKERANMRVDGVDFPIALASASTRYGITFGRDAKMARETESYWKTLESGKERNDVICYVVFVKKKGKPCAGIKLRSGYVRGRRIQATALR